MDSFDPARGLAFSTYAVTRIRGAILDELRRQDHVPRSIRRKTRDIASARETLMRTLGRRPGDGEVAAQLDVDVATVWRWQAEVEGAVHVPMDRTAGDTDSLASAPADYLSDSDDAADVRLGKEEEIAILREAIAKLKDQERTVLSLCYFEELKLHEIAEILGLTDSRVSQIRSRALGRLRESMAPMRV
jgi:RNA polymerase sigma factor for flagellar operon FliA